MNNQKTNTSDSRLLKIYILIIGICMSGFLGFDKYMPYHEMVYFVTYIHLAIFFVSFIFLFYFILKNKKLKFFSFRRICISWTLIVIIEFIFSFIRYQQPFFFTLVEAIFVINPLISMLCISQFEHSDNNEEIITNTLLQISAITNIVIFVAYVLFTYQGIDLLKIGDSALFRNDTVRINSGEMIIYPMIMISFSRIFEKKHNLVDMVNLIFGLINIILVAKTRMVFLGIIMTALLYIVIVKNVNIIIRIMVILAFVVMSCFSIVYMDDLLSEAGTYFSSDMGIQRRFDAIDFYSNQFFENPIFGMGLLGGSKNLINSELLYGPRGVFYRSDVGIIGFINAFGIVGLIWVGYSIIIMLKAGKKSTKNHHLLICTLYSLLTTVSLMFMDSGRSMYLFIMLYLFYFQRNREKQTIVVDSYKK